LPLARNEFIYKKYEIKKKKVFKNIFFQTLKLGDTSGMQGKANKNLYGN
jgi:hypothetical protein